MVKLVDTLASGASGISSRGGSTPLLGTSFPLKGVYYLFIKKEEL